MLSQNRQFQWSSTGACIFPVVMATAATLLAKNGHTVFWSDGIAEKIGLPQFIKQLVQDNPDYIVFEIKAPIIQQAGKLIRIVKEHIPSVKIIIAGDQVVANPKESKKICSADYVCINGHYDFELAQLFGIKETATMPAIKIDRELTKAKLYGEKWRKRNPFMYILSARDCAYGKCSFCSWTSLYPQYSQRKVTEVLEEIHLLITNQGAREIFDDSGSFPGGLWLQTFCKEMLAQGFYKKILFSCNMRFDQMQDIPLLQLMKKAGFRKLKCGLESANQETLTRINKGITVEQIFTGCRNAAQAGLEVHLTIMVGYPWENRNDVERTYALVKKLMRSGYIEMLQSTILVPYPGTPLHREALRNNWFRFDSQEYYRYDMREPVLVCGDMSAAEIMGWNRKIYQLHFDPIYLLRKIQKLRSGSDIMYLLRGAISMLSHVRDFFG